MLSRSVIGGVALAMAPLAAASMIVPALADERLPEIVVSPEAARSGSLTAPGVERQREIVNQTAGSVGFIDSESFKTRFTNTLFDVLKFEPGVFIQPRYGQEQRISIRGSGTARGFHLRGIELLQDGIPVNLADGSGDNYQIDPLALRAVEIYKGGNGLAYGSSTLGGAINFLTQTAHTAVAPNIVRAEAGSFGTIRLNAQVSRVVGDFDWLANATVTHSDGFRAHSRQQAEQVNGNLGWRLGPNVETRFYWGAYIVDQQLPGAISLSDALRNPRIANPTAASSGFAGNQSRETRTERLANRTTIQFENGKLDLDSWVIHKSLYHPIFQVIDQDGWTYGFAPRYAGEFTLGGFRDQLIVGARAFGGNTTALQFVNFNGQRGTQTLNARQNAYNYDAYAENRFFFLPDVALMTGFKALHDERRYEDKGGLPANPLAKSDSRAYDGVNPKIGLLWEPRKDIQFFADLTRSVDVPDFTDLTQTIGATTRFVPLQAQHAWTAEVGARGKWDRVAWNVTLYRSLVRDELLQFSVNPGLGVPATSFNAPRTLHQGIELGLGIEAARDLFATGDKIAVTQLWNHSDFRFRNDPIYAANRIAGIADDVLRTMAIYTHPSGLYFGPTVDWVPTGALADYANTLRVPGYALFGLQAGYQMPNGTLFFLEARNLANKHYVSDISTVADARTTPNAAANLLGFYPGDGRSFFGGVRAAF